MVSITKSKQNPKPKNQAKTKAKTTAKTEDKTEDKTKPKTEDKPKSKTESKIKPKTKSKPKKFRKIGVGLVGLAGIALLSKKGKNVEKIKDKNGKVTKVKVFTKLNEIPVKKTEIKQKKQKYTSPIKLTKVSESISVLPKDYDNSLNPLSDTYYSESESDGDLQKENDILRPEDFESFKDYEFHIKNPLNIDSDKPLKKEKLLKKIKKTIKKEKDIDTDSEQEISKEYEKNIKELIKKLEKEDLKDFIYPGEDVEEFIPEQGNQKEPFNYKKAQKELQKNHEKDIEKNEKYFKTIAKIFKTKKDNINNLLGIPFTEDFKGEWKGNLNNSKIFLINYLVNKYKDVCCTPTNVSFLLNSQTDNITIQNGLKGISVQYNHPEMKRTIIKIAETCPTKRFVIIPIIIHHKINKTKKMYNIDKDTRDMHYLHTNMLIYDRAKNVIEHFEPYGYKETYSKVYENIKKMFSFLNVKYLSPLSVCPTQGPQMMDIKCLKKLPLFKSIGFCIIWSLWYTELRILNPDISSKELIKRYSKNEDELCIFLISYSKFINKFTNRI